MKFIIRYAQDRQMKVTIRYAQDNETDDPHSVTQNTGLIAYAFCY